MKALVLPGLLLVALTLAGLALHVPGAENVGSIPLTARFVAIMGVAGLVYLFAVHQVLRQPPGGGLWWVLLIALAMRVPVLVAPPFLSSDLFRYVWDGRVQLAGINPYRYIPAAPELQGLRDDAIYLHVNRRDYAPTIYPPAAQAIFAGIAAISQTPQAVKTAMLLFEGLAVLCLVRLLALAGLPAARVLIFAWNPLAVWTFSGNGHVDAAGAGLVALALLARALRRDGWAGAVIGAAALTKFLPAVIAPALWRRPDWRMPLAFVAVVLGLYGLYAGVGWQVFGFLHAYGAEEGLNEGGGIWMVAGLQELFTLPSFAGPAFLAAAALGLAALGGWIAFRGVALSDPGREAIRVCGGAALLATLAMIVLSPHYPWYYPWLAVPACIAPWRCAIWLSVAPLLLHLDPLHERFIWPSLVFLPAVVLAAHEAWQRRAASATEAGVTLERIAS